MDLGQKLRLLREQKNWTLAEASEASGISISHLSAIEKGTRQNPSFFIVAKLAECYEVPLTYFLQSDEDISPVGPVAAEAPVAYEEVVKRLAEEDSLDDPSKLLEYLAKYLRDRSSSYRDGDPS